MIPRIFFAHPPCIRAIVTNDPLGCFIFYFLISRGTFRGVGPNSRGLIHDFVAPFKFEEMEKNMCAALQLTCTVQALAVRLSTPMSSENDCTQTNALPFVRPW